MIKHFDKNEIGRDFIVGDIHGCFTLLTETLKAIGFDENVDRLFSVGDLVDRGLESEKCIEWLNKPWFHAVRGNHEQMAIDYINGLDNTGNLIQNGGAWFVGLICEEQRCFAEMYENLPIAIEVQTKSGLIGIIHADCPIDDWNLLEHKMTTNRYAKEYCLWSRERITYKDDTVIDNIHKVYHGHSIVKEQIQYGNVHYIDTGAVFSGKLTIIELGKNENNI